ncbi:tRNA pseudouridine(13) synthase TruD [Idiomarina aminovorans]|uniref:tRNA pseudouridine(13) synthase TruD n=1 Tax=Idiomarina aminovorans TaxID=2914829 RepID=UPI00200372B9|nr:tRNA pseudouridine(13) synthase TruD [Idiomarina sp. ATCH4]MCK7458731.1 tRNA pseudouridine(13) synthase TruD [Idiomarina sp. ATCH4]
MLAPLQVTLADLPRLNEGERPKAEFKQTPQDFQVIEQLDVEDDGEGEHQWLWVRKKGANTHFCAEKIARFAGVSPKNVSYSGLKDRQAVTWQWFSIQLPGKETLNWNELNDEEMSVERVIRRTKKLKSGFHRANRFVIRLANVSSKEALETLWRSVSEQGVINYFGEQRFGRAGDNVAEAERWLMAARPARIRRNKRSLYLSALRSYLFNQIVAGRIRQFGAQGMLAGDCVMLKGSQSVFTVEQWDNELKQRLLNNDIYLTAPLPGSSNKPLVKDEAESFESSLLQPYESWLQAMKKLRVDTSRRALLLRVEAPEISWQGNHAELRFTLPSGAYATTVLNEIVDLSGDSK